MRIDFFETNNGMDTRAVGAGVYMIELENRITREQPPVMPLIPSIKL